MTRQEKVDKSMNELIAEAAGTAQVDAQGAGDLVIPEGAIQTTIFQKQEIRKVCHNNEWWYAVSDVIRAITESEDEGAWRKIKTRLKQEGSEVVADCDGLKMPGRDGKMHLTDCANIETLFRIIQSIPSKKAEPFKRWLAKTGYERVLETQNPEIAIKRAIATYRLQGRDDEWIRSRLQSVVTRNLLTSEWQKRGVQEGPQYAQLTDAISVGAFGKTTKQHKEYKSLKNHHPLRDHMTGLELVLTMLGEEATKEIAIKTDAQGFHQNRDAAKSGGEVAGTARKSIERQTRKPVVSRENFLPGHKQKKLPGD